MKTVFVLFDSLNREALSCYNASVGSTPAFERLASRGVVFDNHYVSSLPCMPARRDLLTGRLSFLHRSWGPVEPFDKCFTSALHSGDVYTHLISDHYHYWEEGGCGYHNRYSSAEFVRGQERDLWKAMIQLPIDRFKEQYHDMLSGVERRSPNMVNREYIRHENDFPIVGCVDLACEFLAENNSADNWLLQVELFDPHEPFTAPKRFRQNLQTDYDGPILDWPLYDQLDLSDSEKQELRANYLAVVAMCDEQLGRLLDTFDAHNLWEDTAIVLTTDHGFLLGEHDWWGKNVMPVLDPIAHIPLIIYQPSAVNSAGQRRTALTQCLDIPATLLNLHSQATTSEPCTNSQKQFTYGDGKSILPLLSYNGTFRDCAVFGLFGGAINITDGRYTYFRYPVDAADTLYEYTLMPVHPTSYFTQEEMQDAELVKDIDFANGFPLLKIKASDKAKRPPMQGGALTNAKTVLYDLQSDPGQLSEIHDGEIEQSLLKLLTETLQRSRAPAELFKRFGLEKWQ